MATFRVRTPISYGTFDQFGRLVQTEYQPGDTIDLTREEAEKIRHALLNPPPPSVVRAMDKEERRAYDSDVASPFHPESDAVLRWKQDGASLSVPMVVDDQVVSSPEAATKPREQSGSTLTAPEVMTVPKEVKAKGKR
jgi:hypothetical protein